MMCYHSAVPELFHDKSDVCSDGIPGASCSVSCHSGHPAHALLVTLSGGGRAPTCRGNARPHPGPQCAPHWPATVPHHDAPVQAAPPHVALRL
ncbi:hypothetical protein OsI_23412 [Oryza sativa Indica Group]|uniref:Uncharacterized protein n=1 Tax=Oryza sativa subsp. indica TaxID=39946 RepID=B8B3T4_ORYSI|nr:hypothetical protein OsI_23412 [Oryza sativa Indica Group]